MLLCKSHSEAAVFYQFLKAFHPKFEVYFDLQPHHSFLDINMEIIEGAQWNGDRFHGVVIACTPNLRNIPFDIIFLDNVVKSTHVLIAILTPLQRLVTQRKESNGILIDFQNDFNAVMRLLPPNFPVHLHDKPENIIAPISTVNTESFEMGLHKLSDALSQYQFEDARKTFLYLQSAFPTDAKQLSEELEFLFNPLMSLEKQKRCWEQHRIELEWKSSLWNLFSKHSKTALKIVKEAELDQQEILTEAVDEEDALIFSAEGTSQEKGELLENAALELFRRLFELDKTESADILERLRKQRAGLQNGFDITFTYRDGFGVSTTCAIECKNYPNGLIRLQDVAAKLVSLQHLGGSLDSDFT